jgi:pimeloyl-ACP methyl ester carboxylesterase
MADSVKAVLDYLKINNCIMLGHSMGGYTTLAFADKYPALLKGFGLFHSSALADTPEAKENRNNIIKIVKQDNIKFVRQFITSLFAPENVKIYEKDIRQQQHVAIKMSKQDIIAAIRGMAKRKSTLEVLIKSKVPVLFIIGKKDPRIPYDKVLAQATLPKHSEILMLDNVGHMGYLEAQNETLKTIKCFAEKIFL